MGASDRILRGYIPSEEVADATTWEFQSLTGAPVRAGTRRVLSERERQAYEKGVAAGLTQGLAQAAAQRASHTARIDAVLGALRSRFSELESNTAQDLLAMALAIARHVLRHEVHVNREAVLPVLTEALNTLADQQAHPRIHLNPEDHALLAHELDGQSQFARCQFVADASVGRGGCVVETPKGEIDARLGTRWRCVLEALGLHDAISPDDDPPS
ncbi:MAG TPA: FliH/SctL family protein [Burkholderiaceae bacterium]|nr:FliH/SctL family protein [Burkholderiaceae bacterium]